MMIWRRKDDHKLTVVPIETTWNSVAILIIDFAAHSLYKTTMTRAYFEECYESCGYLKDGNMLIFDWKRQIGVVEK